MNARHRFHLWGIPSSRFLYLTYIMLAATAVHPLLMMWSCGFEHGARYAAGQLTYLVYHCCIVPPIFAHMWVVMYCWLPQGKLFSLTRETAFGAICLFIGVSFAGYATYDAVLAHIVEHPSDIAERPTAYPILEI